MFNKIEINYPEFGLKLEREFTPGINLIEEPNGYGKSTIINTLLSLYSKKYPGLRTLPSGSAKIYTDDKIYLLSKALWVGLEESNPLIKYILPGEFFSMTTPEQRLTLVKLLDIDFDGYMKEHIPEWNDKLEKELKARLKENEGKESIILDDIVRFKSIVIAFEKNPITIEDNSKEIESKYQEYVSSYNKDKLAIQIENNKIDSDISRNQIDITNINNKLEELRNEFNRVKTICDKCGADLNEESIKITKAKINEEGKELAKQLNILKGKKFDDKKKVPDDLPERDINQKASFLKMELKMSNQTDYDSVNEYQSAKRELKIKEDLLKTLGELKDKETLTLIKKYKNKFTEDLEIKVKELGLEIELFKTQANGEIVESFQIMLDSKPYSELSGGNRLLCQIRLSLAFVKKLGLDFILIDEAGTVSQNNFDIISRECKGLQVIIARATPFQVSDITKTKKETVKSKKK